MEVCNSKWRMEKSVSWSALLSSGDSLNIEQRTSSQKILWTFSDKQGREKSHAFKVILPGRRESHYANNFN